MRILITTFCLVLCLFSFSFANDTSKITLNNGDIINAKVIDQSKTSFVIESDILGKLTIDRKHIKDIVSLEKPKERQGVKNKKIDSLWEKEVSLGFSKISGNTISSNASSSLFLNRKTSHDELTLKVNAIYGSSNNKMDTQKWYSLLRYAFSFKDKRWYNFYKLETDHDRFTNIDYRLIPTTGVGYWFSDTDSFKAMVELGVGCEYTSFRDDTKSNCEAILIPRAFLEKKLFDKLTFFQELVFYPKLDNAGDFRLHSESALKNYIDDKLSLKLSFIDDYNSSPDNNTKKNDSRFITSINYEF